jgi:subtilisin family serine protease
MRRGFTLSLSGTLKRSMPRAPTSFPADNVKIRSRSGNTKNSGGVLSSAQRERRVCQRSRQYRRQEKETLMNRTLRAGVAAKLTLVVTLTAILGWVSPSATANGRLPNGGGQEQRGPDGPKRKALHKPEKRFVKKMNAIRGEYIVVLDDDVVGKPGEGSWAADLPDVLVSTYGGKVRDRFKHAINAFTASMTEAQAQAMSEDPLVAYVQEESEVSVAAIQTPATWGLDRVDQRPRTLTNSYSYDYTGAGVVVYVVDTGIRTNHVDFGGRAFAGAGWDLIGDGANGQDCHGHGTHVAATIGGNAVGVAKRVTLQSVRVFNCVGKTGSGTFLKAVDLITAYARKPAVVNMSLTAGGIDTALDAAISRSVNAGITYVVAAGNAGVDACMSSPARSPGTITVGATDWLDQRAIFGGGSSNWGACVDVWAPGHSIVSAAHSSTTGWVSMSGTSMASPHVAGAAAVYLSVYPTATPAAVRTIISNTATVGRLTGIGSTSPNRLLYSLMRY